MIRRNVSARPVSSREARSGANVSSRLGTESIANIESLSRSVLNAERTESMVGIMVGSVQGA